MTDVTAQMLRYRECLRGLWNVWFVDDVDEAWDPFTQVERLLLNLLIFRDMPGANATIVDSYYPSLRLGVAEKKVAGERIYHLKRTSKTYNQSVELSSIAELDIRFCEFWDWDRTELRDFRYAIGTVVASKRADVRVGEQIVIPALDARFQVFSVES